MDGACWACFCCRHSPVKDMNVQILWVHAMECMCEQTRPQIILSLERIFLGNGVEPMLTPREKSPLPEVMRRIEPTALHQAGHLAQNSTDWATLAPTKEQDLAFCYWEPQELCGVLVQFICQHAFPKHSSTLWDNKNSTVELWFEFHLLLIARFLRVTQ